MLPCQVLDNLPRWNLHNGYKEAGASAQASLHAELKHAYCSTRRLDADRMECGPGTYFIREHDIVVCTPAIHMAGGIILCTCLPSVLIWAARLCLVHCPKRTHPGLVGSAKRGATGQRHREGGAKFNRSGHASEHPGAAHPKIRHRE